MALIICTECGKQISDQAAACIHCGNPTHREVGNLIVYGKPAGALSKPIYYLYRSDGTLFDTVLAGEEKRFQINEPITLILGHKRGSFVGCAVSDSKPVCIDPTRITYMELSISAGFFDKEYHINTRITT